MRRGLGEQTVSILNAMFKLKNDPAFVLNLLPQMNQKVYTSLIRRFINLEVLRASNIILQFATLMQMKEKDTWAGKRPQWAKRLAAKPENLGPIPNTHMAEGEKRLLQIALWPPQACCGMYLPTSLPATQPTYIHTYKTSSKIFFEDTGLREMVQSTPHTANNLYVILFIKQCYRCQN